MSETTLHPKLERLGFPVPVSNLPVSNEISIKERVESGIGSTEDLAALELAALGSTIEPEVEPAPLDRTQTGTRAGNWLLFAAAVLLVSVPVFIQAPLVRFLPWLSLVGTLGWAALALRLSASPRTDRWGDLLMGFTWTWLSGSLYWGWLRWEPFFHLPVEAIGLPFAVWGLSQGRGKIGNWFYLGSLFGTAVTDLYFYIVRLIPHWRSLMQVEPDAVHPIFQSAIAQMQTGWGIGWAIGLATLLLGVSLVPLRSKKSHGWAFSGAVFSTILVDGLFWLAAATA